MPGVYDPYYGGDYDDSWDGSPYTSIDPYDHVEWDDPDGWRTYPTIRRGVYWDRETRKWACTCYMYCSNGICKHTYHFRPEQTVKVDEKYL